MQRQSTCLQQSIVLDPFLLDSAAHVRDPRTLDSEAPQLARWHQQLFRRHSQLIRWQHRRIRRQYTALSAQFAVASTTATLSQCTAATPATVPAQQLVPATWLLTVDGAILYNLKPCRFYVLAIP